MTAVHTKTPLEFMLYGKLRGESVGLNLIPGYVTKVLKLKFLWLFLCNHS